MNGKVCQVCQQKVAKIHITQIQNSQVMEFHICPDCAREHGVGGPEGKPVFSISEFVGGIISGEEAARADTAEAVSTCAACGQNYRGFRESGRLGCCQCYEAFEAELQPLLRKVQSGLKHVGKNPGGQPAKVAPDASPIIQLKREQLKIAISEEDFESAAKLRDEIKTLEGKPLS
jgi:protein arginine kinase activator